MPNLNENLRQPGAATPTVPPQGSLSLRLWTVFKPFWVDKRLWYWNIAHVAIILGLLYGNSRVNVAIAQTLKDYMDAIFFNNATEQAEQVKQFLILMACITPIQVGNAFLQGYLGLRWRQWMEKVQYFTGYFTNFAWAKLLRRPDIDNPDQRLTDNIAAYCGFSVQFMMATVGAGVDIYMWLPVLWKDSRELAGAVAFWAVVGSIAAVVLGRVLYLIAKNNAVATSEANLRSSLQENIRKADDIALYQAEDIARVQAETRVDSVIKAMVDVAKRNAVLQAFQTPWNGVIPWFAPFFLAPLFAHGVVKFGSISEATLAVGALYNALNLIANQFGGLANYAALVNRLGSLQEALNGYAKPTTATADQEIIFSQGPDIVFDNVTIKSEDGEDSVKALNVVLRKGEGLCVFGRGSSATDLVRTLGRIWNEGSGKVTVPAREEIMFLTQTPYLPSMTLREAVNHPNNGGSPTSDEDILKALALVQLDDLPSRSGGLDAVQNWNTFLPLSERQRLSIARIMFKHPDYVVVQEATSVLEPDAERLFYALLSKSNTTIVSMVNKAELAKFHKWVLSVNSDGTWKLEKASDFVPPANSGDGSVEPAAPATPVSPPVPAPVK